jgi:hypothetical protein
MRRFIAALQEGEISTDEFTILAWLGIVGEWHGKLTELHAALQWPHTPKHLGRLVHGLRERGLVEYTARERSRAPFDLALTIPVVPVESACSQDVSGVEAGHPGSTTHTRHRQGTAHDVMSDARDELSVLSSKLSTQHSSIDTGTRGSGPTGTHRSSPSLSSDSGDGSRVESPEASQTNPSEAGKPLGEPDPEAQARLLAALEAELGPEPDPYGDLSPATRRHFGLDNPDAWHGDERTGDTTPEDERSLLEWAADNPAKAYGRKIRADIAQRILEEERHDH